MKSDIIYLDYMSSTPIDNSVLEGMMPYMTNPLYQGNSLSLHHKYGQYANDAIIDATEHVKNVIKARDEDKIIFTSGATESINTAIKGIATFYSRKGKHIISLETEHTAVLATLEYLELHGFEVSLIRPKKNGLVDNEDIKNAIREDTILISIAHVNSEIGVIQDIDSIGKIARKNGIIFHVDAAQSLGKIPINCIDSSVDLLSMSSHKIYGPKGIGALYISSYPKVRINNLIHGGGHQMGLRGGTLPTHQIVGFGLACKQIIVNYESEIEHINKLNKIFVNNLKRISGVTFNGDLVKRVPHNINFSISDIHAETLMFSLDDIAISTASACKMSNLVPSHVLKSIGVSDDLSSSTMRISIGRYTTLNDINKGFTIISNAINKIRNIYLGKNEYIFKNHDETQNTTTIKVRTLFNNAKFFGIIPQGNNEYSIEVGNKSMGVWFKLQIIYENNIIKNVKYRAYGCPYTIALCEFISNSIINKPKNTLLDLSEGYLSKSLNIPAHKEYLSIMFEESCKDIYKKIV